MTLLWHRATVPPSPSVATSMTQTRTVKLDIASRFEMLDVVQTVVTHLAALVGFDEDATHYMSVAVRESVVNAIKHGNGLDPEKRVELVFTIEEKALEVTHPRPGPGLRPELRPRSPGPGEPAEGRRPRDLLHEVVHGRGRLLVPARGRHARPHGQAALGATSRR